ncbi:MAG: hypothetical protein ACJ76I_10040 [Gaiellaceae bacterium]
MAELTLEILYDASGRETEDEAEAVRGVLVELDESGNVIRELDRWTIDLGPGATLNVWDPPRRLPRTDLREPS